MGKMGDCWEKKEWKAHIMIIRVEAIHKSSFNSFGRKKWWQFNGGSGWIDKFAEKVDKITVN